jgi:hypothetical protein
MDNCQNEDQCETPMWCRGKDKCQKQVESDKATGPLDAAACSHPPAPDRFEMGDLLPAERSRRRC